MTKALPYSKLKRGTFLIASPEINEGVYFRSVILLCEHTVSGSFGLMIDKPMDIELPEELGALENWENSHIQLRTGGPMQPSQMMLLHDIPDIPEQTLQVCPGVFLGGDLQFLQKSLKEKNSAPMLLCFGYCGWGPGALEREFLDGAWYLHPAAKEHIFETPPEVLWRTILREMGGKYASLSMIPEDLSLN
ncbi:MAG: YqgE/AlgH family protein [Simkaniaceae bacterium]